MNYPKTILYSGASELVLGAAWTYTTSIPNWTYVLLGFLGENDAATETAISKPDRNKLIFFLSPNIHLYIEVNAKTAGFLDSKNNHVQQVNIYDRDSKFVNQIAHIINDSYKTGILNEIIWEKIEKKFDINREHEIQMWQEILAK
jgi:hypothetical protein